jgi:dihydroxy-acid dehydratase
VLTVVPSTIKADLTRTHRFPRLGRNERGGPIAAVQDGDQITIDIDARRLDVDLSDEEIAKRVDAYQPPEPRYKRGVMAKYAASVSSAAEGAVTG